jgi:DNA-binding transcriptional MerR regulator
MEEGIDSVKQHSRSWMSTREFSAKYGVTQWTARRWARQGKVTAIRVPPGPRARIFILDPKWTQVAASTSCDPVEWFSFLRQSETALLLGISARGLRYLESIGRAHYRLVGHRKLYDLAEVRRLMAARALGYSPRSRQEKRQGVLRWAFEKLHQN